MTLVAYDAGAGQVDGRALALTAAQALYFAGTIFYVKSAIRECGNRPFLLLSVGYHLVATAIAAALSWWLAGVFALLTLRALVVPPRGFSPKALGIGEVAATVVVTTTSVIVL